MSQAPTESPVDVWDALLARDESARDSARLRRWFEQREMTVPDGDGSERPLCTVLRPHMVDEELYRRQARAAGLVVAAARKVRDGVVADPALHLRHFGRFHEWMGGLLDLDARPVADGTVMRLDASITAAGLRFIELNADTPQGVGHNDRTADFFEQLGVFERFSERFPVRDLRLEQGMLDTLVRTWRDWGGRGEPTIATVSLRSRPVIWTGLEIDAEYRRSRGVDTLVCEPQELDFDGRRLRVGDRCVDVVQRVLLAADCVEHRERMASLLDAVAADAVCMVNAFRSELLGHKAIFALLSDPDQDFGFTAAERAAVREHVPWTRIVADDATTDAGGRSVDLLDHVASERERLVLKPTHDAGGHGVHLGWTLSQAEWEAALGQATEADFVVQERVELAREAYPTLDDPGREDIFYEDTDPFLFRGRVGGMLVRLSATEITNVSDRGAVVASFVVDAD